MSLTPPPQFFNAYAQGFARCAVATPLVRLADPARNVERIAALARRADDAGAAVLLTPELSVSGYAIDDLLHQGALLDAVEAAIARLAQETAALRPLIVVGAPLRLAGRLHNCGVVLHRGAIIGDGTPEEIRENRTVREVYLGDDLADDSPDGRD